MANIGTFTADKDGFTGTLRTLTLNVKVKLVPNDKGDNEKAPDFRLQAASHDIGAAWKKTSEAGREYISVTLDDPSFPATVYARLIEGEDGTHDLIWSRSKPQAACPPPAAPRHRAGRCAVVLVRTEPGGRRWPIVWAALLCGDAVLAVAIRAWRVGATRRRTFTGYAPCRLCRHGHPAPIPHAFAPAALRTSLASEGKPYELSPPRTAWRPSMQPEPTDGPPLRAGFQPRSSALPCCIRARRRS